MNGVLVRNSRILGVFVEIVHGPQGSLRAVELAGRGIAAEAGCTLAALAEKTRPTPSTAYEAIEAGLEYADRLMELGVVEDGLVELWKRRCLGDLEDAAFEVLLHEIVARLEAWP